MIFPHIKEEMQLSEKGFKFVAGIDEAGRGALAGPVVAVAVVMPFLDLQIKDVRDSKLLTPKKREKLFDEIIDNCLGYGVGIVDHKIIDKINIYQASRLAMKLAVKNIKSIIPDYLLIDAMEIEIDIPQKPIIGGDLQSYSIAAASIIAKVTRDRLMRDFHKQYCNYRFDKHKGYGTKQHMEHLNEYGPCKIHRFSYKPISVFEFPKTK